MNARMPFFLSRSRRCRRTNPLHRYSRAHTHARHTHTRTRTQSMSPGRRGAISMRARGMEGEGVAFLCITLAPFHRSSPRARTRPARPPVTHGMCTPAKTCVCGKYTHARAHTHTPLSPSPLCRTFAVHVFFVRMSCVKTTRRRGEKGSVLSLARAEQSLCTTPHPCSAHTRARTHPSFMYEPFCAPVRCSLRVCASAAARARERVYDAACLLASSERWLGSGAANRQRCASVTRSTSYVQDVVAIVASVVGRRGRRGRGRR